MNNVIAGTPLGILAPNTTPIERVPAVTNLDFLPDMGRMSAPPTASPDPHEMSMRAARRKLREMVKTLNQAMCEHREAVRKLARASLLSN